MKNLLRNQPEDLLRTRRGACELALGCLKSSSLLWELAHTELLALDAELERRERPPVLSVKIANVTKRELAKPLVRAFQCMTYIRFEVLVCPVGGSFDVLVQTHYDTTEEDFTGMVLHVLATEVYLKLSPALRATAESLTTVTEDLAEAHAEERDADHHGDTDCAYCRDLEEARKRIVNAETRLRF